MFAKTEELREKPGEGAGAKSRAGAEFWAVGPGPAPQKGSGALGQVWAGEAQGSGGRQVRGG